MFDSDAASENVASKVARVRSGEQREFVVVENVRRHQIDRRADRAQ